MVTESLARVLAMARSAVGLAEGLLGDAERSVRPQRVRRRLVQLRGLIEAMEQLNRTQR